MTSVYYNGSAYGRRLMIDNCDDYNEMFDAIFSVAIDGGTQEQIVDKLKQDDFDGIRLSLHSNLEQPNNKTGCELFFTRKLT